MSSRVDGAEADVRFSLEEVSDGVFAYVQPDGSWMINNTGFLVGRDGVSAIDACSTERRTRDLLTTIGGVTSAPVRTLVNTHHHPDHTAGNGLFTGATIVAHEFFFQAEDGIRDGRVTGVQTCALPIYRDRRRTGWARAREQGG